MRYCFTQFIIILLSFIPPNVATPGLSDWLNSALPVKGSGLEEEIKCYSLPYGWIGFCSHILTYYTFFMLCIGYSPWLPWKRLKHWKIDFVLTTIATVLTVGIAIFTMIRCRSGWPFVLIACWKLLLSVTLCGTSFHVVLKLYRANKNTGMNGRATASLLEKAKTASRSAEQQAQTDESVSEQMTLGAGIIGWITIHFIGTLIGYVGLFKLVSLSWEIIAIQAVVYEFVGFLMILGLGIGGAIYILEKGNKKDNRLPIAVGPAIIIAVLVFVFELLGVFFSDWILGVIAGNFSGTPDGNNAVVFWVYFAAKRLPFLGL